MTQLVDIFAYELPTKNIKKIKIEDKLNSIQSKVLVYTFHSIFFQNYFYFFIQNNIKTEIFTSKKQSESIETITELFKSANWLEREVSELHALSFSGKKDLRNLMLQYGDSTAPFQKSFPSVGIKEMYYNPIKDTLVQNKITVQL